MNRESSEASQEPCDRRRQNNEDDTFHDLINFLDPNSWNIEEVVVPWLSAEEKLRKFSKVFGSFEQSYSMVENKVQAATNNT